MKKIGIIVSRVSSGAEILYSSEAAKPWVKEALDTRNYLKCFQIEKMPDDKLASSFFDFLTFGTNVAFLCTNKYISGRDSDLISAMIVVPGDVDVAGAELEQILFQTKKILKATIRDDKELESLFSVDYGAKPVPGYSKPSIKPDVDGRYAYRYYGNNTPYSLPELLDSLFQVYYNEYKAIFLLDNSSNIEIEEALVDLTDKDFKKPCILVCPTNKPQNIDISVNGQPFVNNLIFNEGDKARVEIIRKGCYPITTNVIFDEQKKFIKLSNLDWEYVVDPSWFVIFDKNTKEKIAITPAITINKKNVDGYNRFKEQELKPANIKISVPDYEDFSFPVYLLSQQRPFKIFLDKKPRKIKYVLGQGCRVQDQEIAFTLEGTHLNTDHSPIEGYEVSRQLSKNTFLLEKKQSTMSQGLSRKWLLILSALGLLSLFGLWSIGSNLYNIIFKTEKNPNIDQTECDKCHQLYDSNLDECPNCQDFVDSGSDVNNSLSDKEKKYLIENQSKWTRTEMASITSRLGKLYDDVNTRQFDKITGEWNTLLSIFNISYWQNIVNAVNSRRSDLKPGSNYSGDGTITISSYINNLRKPPSNQDDDQNGGNDNAHDHNSSNANTHGGSNSNANTHGGNNSNANTHGGNNSNANNNSQNNNQSTTIGGFTGD